MCLEVWLCCSETIRRPRCATFHLFHLFVLVIAGVCKQVLRCGKRNQFEETGETCNCNNADSDTFADSRTCKRCYARKSSPAGQGVFYTNPQGLSIECTSCKAPQFMLNGRCVAASQCPATMAQYLVGSFNGRCETPFSCVGGKREGGDTPGGNCKCRKSSLCRDCSWQPGRSEQQCLHCKKHTLLLNGDCVSAANCVGRGLIPIKGTGPLGGRCLPSGVSGTDE